MKLAKKNIYGTAPNIITSLDPEMAGEYCYYHHHHQVFDVFDDEDEDDGGGK